MFDASDLSNPGGESLAGEPVSVGLPDLGDPVAPVIRWTAVDDAVGYRVYRSPEADAASGQESWLADVTDGSLSYTDWGDPVDTALLPLPDGALGKWASVASLSTARSGACLTVASDPHPDPEIVHLYVAGGEDADGDVLADIERLEITVASPRSQVAGTWEAANQTLSEARTRCVAFSVGSDRHSLVDDDESWVLFGGGYDGRRAVGTVDAGRVDVGGELSDWQEADAMSPARAGFAGASASNFLYAFGGQNDRPSAGGTSAALETPMPDFHNWNSLGTSMSESRYLPAFAQESAVIFVIGGETTTSTASTSTDWTNY